jgi:hypothetical protein
MPGRLLRNLWPDDTSTGIDGAAIANVLKYRPATTAPPNVLVLGTRNGSINILDCCRWSTKAPILPVADAHLGRYPCGSVAGKDTKDVLGSCGAGLGNFAESLIELCAT